MLIKKFDILSDYSLYTFSDKINRMIVEHQMPLKLPTKQQPVPHKLLIDLRTPNNSKQLQRHMQENVWHHNHYDKD